MKEIRLPPLYSNLSPSSGNRFFKSITEIYTNTHFVMFSVLFAALTGELMPPTAYLDEPTPDNHSLV